MFFGPPDPHPAPLDRVTDPRIHTKMSRIRNNGPKHLTFTRLLFYAHAKSYHTQISEGIGVKFLF
jgi:hypothetical protein